MYGQVTLRDAHGGVLKKKQFVLGKPLSIRGLQDQVRAAFNIPRSWDLQCFFGNDEDRQVMYCVQIGDVRYTFLRD